MRIGLLLLALAANVAAEELSLFRALSRPEGQLPSRFRFFRDGTRIAYVRARDGQEQLSDLWVYDIAQGKHAVLVRAEKKQELSPEEMADKERRRDKTTGIGEYRLHPKDGSVMLVLSGDLYRYRDGKMQRLTETKSHERHARWSPDGESIAFVRDRNLYVLRGGKEQRLTWHGAGKTRCGLPEFIAMEELGRHDGFWWSPDSKLLAYVRTESHQVPGFVYHDYLDDRGKAIEQEYPRAGDPNVVWWLKVIPVAGGRPVTMKLEGEYLVRVEWTPDGALAVQTADRLQRSLKLFRCDPKTGESTLLLHEKDPAWVSFHADLRFLEDGRFLWTSERTGRRHLYLWDKGELSPLTSGDWDVAAVLGVDGKAGTVHFTGARESPHERHLYRVGLDGKGLARLTTEPGWHGVQRSRDGRWFLDTYSRMGVPPRVVLRDAEGREVAELARSLPLPELPQPRFLTLPADDGTDLHALLYRAQGDKRGPGIIHCYGGPGSHIVRDRWGGGFHLWHTRLSQQGYSVLLLDGRGAGGYGRDFSRIVSGRLCDWEVRDQAAGARWLSSRPFVDPKRVGIWGWSYGGTLTLMCLLHASEAFAAGVAVAPVTDWRDYDTAYTERYLGLPKDNPEGYALSSPITAAQTLGRPLLLAHGFLDDNVHFRGAVAFVEQTKHSDTLVETAFYVKGRHGIGDFRDRLLLFRRIESFWARHLR